MPKRLVTAADVATLLTPDFTLEAVKTITGATAANPGVITATAHGYATGDFIVQASVGGNTTSNGLFKITVVNANSYSIAVNTTAGGAYTSGGTAQRVLVTLLLRDADPFQLEQLLDALKRVPGGTSRAPGDSPFALEVSIGTWLLGKTP